jgi:hypothetical protein
MTVASDFRTFKAAYGTKAEILAFADTLIGQDFVVERHDTNWAIYDRDYYYWDCVKTETGED